MNLRVFKSLLARNPEQLVSFVLPDVEIIQAHYNITEVGHVTKRFIDCGGTRREASSCQLQVWLGSDADHRLPAGKLAGILELAAPILPSDDLDLEVEYEACAISQYQVAAGEAQGDGLRIELASKHTDCLAKEACGVEEDSCCGGKGSGELPAKR